MDSMDSMDSMDTESTDGDSSAVRMTPMGHFKDIIGGETVTVTVGSDNNKETFVVPKALLCKVRWFKTAFESDRYREGVTGHATLPDDHAEAFEALQYYLYHGSLAFAELRWAMYNYEDLNRELESCVRIWIFSDKYGVSAMQNASILRACDIMTHRETKMGFGNPYFNIAFETLELVHDSTSGGSPLRALMADYVVYKVLEKKVPYSEFKALEAYDGFLKDWNAARHAYDHHSDNERGAEFPRCIQPYKYAKLFSVNKDDDGDDLIDDLIDDRPDSTSYGWEQTKPGCTECKSGEASDVCLDCGGGEGEKFPCPHCKSKYIGQLCGGCGATYKKASIAEHQQWQTFMDGWMLAHGARVMRLAFSRTLLARYGWGY